MGFILSLETATNVCSVALHENGQLRLDFSLYVEKAHSTHLADLIERSIGLSGIKKTDLSAVAISKGPGSYTGLRIGTSMAKGICFGLNIPLIAIDTLEALAWQLHNYFPGTILCPMIDARRMEVYYLLKDEHFETIHETDNLIVTNESFQDLLDIQPVCFFGNGAIKCKELLGGHPNARFIDSISASATSIGALAESKYENQDFEDLAYFEPFYLKQYIAGKPKKLV